MINVKKYKIEDLPNLGTNQVYLYKNELIDANSLFESIYQIGNKLLNDNFESRDEKYDPSEFSYYWNNKSKIDNLAKNYLKDDMTEEGIHATKFVEFCIRVAVAYRIFALKKNLEEIDNEIDFDFDYEFFPKLVRISFFDEYHFFYKDEIYEDYLLMVDTIGKDKSSYDWDEQKEYTLNILNRLIEFIVEKTQKLMKDYNYTINSTYITFIKKTPYICNTANSLFAIVFNQLLLNITGFNIDARYKICIYEKCCNRFIPKKNRQVYCPECVKNNIPNLIKNRRYNRKPGKRNNPVA